MANCTLTNAVTYANCSVGPAVTLTTGTSVLVIVTSSISTPVSSQGWASFATVANCGDATDTRAVMALADGLAAHQLQASTSTLVTGLTAGFNTFTMCHRTSGAITFANRTITVIPLN
ncbi:MAG TPA: hypothetical protein VGR61_05515 [Candidatus Dormibacteraeota bacterium]|nr:hypothetical protein [Candidatus Dormibacteraeota bacterium]